MALSDERRKRKRVALHWPVRLFRHPATQSVESVTDNLSSEGFYCVSREPFQPGERLKCVIVIHGGSVGDLESAARLECHVTVMRVEDLYSDFGLGCHIDDYAFFTGSPYHPLKRLRMT
jgi:hypothetical protein